MAQILGTMVLEALVGKVVESAWEDMSKDGDSSSGSSENDPFRYSKITNYTISNPSVPELQM